jgi:Ca2+-binding RTX toxin-like protein
VKRISLVIVVGALLLALVAAVAVAADAGRTFQCETPTCEGTDRDDTISERDGTVQDDIDALGGNDTVNAALFGSDADTVEGSPGNDVIRADDGDTRDSVNGGAGKDVCIVDRGDDVKDCEDVIRRR